MNKFSDLPPKPSSEHAGHVVIEDWIHHYNSWSGAVSTFYKALELGDMHVALYDSNWDLQQEFDPDIQTVEKGVDFFIVKDKT